MATVKLPRLPVNWREQPQLFERYWDDAMASIETALNAVLSLPEIQAAIDAAQTAADNAQDAADNANGAATSVTSETSLVNSFPTNFTPPLVQVDNTGLVTIANHDRQYGDSTMNPTVSVVGDTVATGGVAGDIVRIFYDDPTRAGGAVAYQYTVDPAAPPVQGGDTHSVGAGIVPGAGTQDGNELFPPGYAFP